MRVILFGSGFLLLTSSLTIGCLDLDSAFAQPFRGSQGPSPGFSDQRFSTGAYNSNRQSFSSQPFSSGASSYHQPFQGSWALRPPAEQRTWPEPANISDHSFLFPYQTRGTRTDILPQSHFDSRVYETPKQHQARLQTEQAMFQAGKEVNDLHENHQDEYAGPFFFFPWIQKAREFNERFGTSGTEPTKPSIQPPPTSIHPAPQPQPDSVNPVPSHPANQVSEKGPTLIDTLWGRAKDFWNKLH